MWLESAQSSRLVPSTAGSIKSDTINTTDADVYSYREEWDLSGGSSEPRTSRSIDESDCDCNSYNINDDIEESDCELQLKAEAALIIELNTPLEDPDKLQPALHDDGVPDNASQRGLDAVAGELDDPDSESQSTPALREEAKEAISTPASMAESPRIPPGGVTGSNDCEDTRDSIVIDPDSNRGNAASTSADVQDGETRRVQVLVRVRPPTGSADDTVVVAVGEQGTSIQIQSSNNHGSLGGPIGAGGMTTVTECAFDRVFGPSATQEDLFSAVEPSVRAAIDGYNATVFAYGQTGTGKTHTLFGKDFDTFDVVSIAAPSLTEEKNSGLSKPPAASPRPSNMELAHAPATAPMWGVVPRALRLLLSHAARLEADSAAAITASERVQASLHCSFVQIYNDRLFDLFTDRRRQKPLLLREQPRVDGSTNVVVQGLSSERIVSVAHALQLLRRGLENRSVRETEANLASSRSHAIVQVNITVERTSPTGERTTRTSRLNLVDLAGSEKWNTDIPMDEAHSLELKNINASLSALGNCIAALAEPGRKHIPYRDSTLTRVLQDSLGGSAQSCLIATVSPSLNASDETIRTLQFADRARSVMQTVRINEASAANGSTAMMMTTELLVARTQIAKLREKLESAQRRHHEARLKELETCQRKFSEVLKEKDREISKLARENAGFLKWKEEDARRIRELEAQVRELEDKRDSTQQFISSAAVKVVDDRSERTWSESSTSDHGSDGDSARVAADSPLSPTTETDSARSGGAARVRRNDLTRKMQRSVSKANLPRLANEKSKEVPLAAQGSRTYKQLLERYALQPGKGKCERGTEQRDRLPNTTRQLELTFACDVPSSDAVRSPHAAPPLSSLKDASYSASSPLLPIATRIPRVANVSPRDLSVVTSAKPSPSGLLAMRRSPSPLSPRRMESEAIQALCQAMSGWEAAVPRPAATTSSLFPQRVEVAAFHSPSASASNPPTTKVATDVLEAWKWKGTATSGDAEAASLPAARKPATTLGVCAKHSLRGCVLCSGAMDSNHPRPTVVTQTESTPTWSPQVEVTCLVSPNEPCARHCLARCFICGKTTVGGGRGSSGSAASSKTVAVYPVDSATTGTTSSAAAATSSVGMTVTMAKCSAHSLSNCILCSNKASSNSSAALFSKGAPATEAVVPHAEYPPHRYTLDVGLLDLSSSSLSTSSTSSLFSHSPASSTLPDDRSGAMSRYLIPQQLSATQAPPYASITAQQATSSDPYRHTGWPQSSAWANVPS